MRTGRGRLRSRWGHVPPAPRIWAGALPGLWIRGLGVFGRGSRDEGLGAEGAAAWWRSGADLAAELCSASTRPPPGGAGSTWPAPCPSNGQDSGLGQGIRMAGRGYQSGGRPPRCGNRTLVRHHPGSWVTVLGFQAPYIVPVSWPLFSQREWFCDIRAFFFLMCGEVFLVDFENSLLGRGWEALGGQAINPSYAAQSSTG